MDKQNVVYTYNGILFSLKKEGNFEKERNVDYIITWTNHEVVMLSEISYSQKDKYCLILLFEVLRIDKLRDRKWNKWCY